MFVESRKIHRKQLVKNSAVENSSQVHEINSVKYGANFVILLYYQQTTKLSHSELTIQLKQFYYG